MPEAKVGRPPRWKRIKFRYPERTLDFACVVMPASRIPGPAGG